MIVRKSVFILSFAGMLMAGCQGQTSLRQRETGALAGGALGAGLGAIVGNQVGNSGAAIAIGSALGAVSGGLIGNSLDAQEEQLNNRDKRLQQNERELSENKRLIEELRARGIDARGTERGVVANLPDVLFEFDSDRLTPSARRAAQDIAEVARSARGRALSVEGHTDSVGTASYNKTLSTNRARAVADELAQNGVPSRKISVRGYGESRPLASNANSQGRQKNRRVEVILEN